MVNQTAAYENRVVCFIDILGFKHLISKTVDKNGNDIGTEISNILDVFSAVRHLLGIDEDPSITEGVNITHFSDSIIISFPVNSEGGVFDILLHLLWVQISLIKRGILVRGSITVEKILHTDKEVFGPGVIFAYELEQKAAVYPRIILSEKVVQVGIKGKAKHNSSHYEEDSIRSFLQKDTDGMLYLDYFGASAFGEMDDPLDDPHKYLLGIKTLVEDGLKAKDPSVLIKYQWMKERYNTSLENIQQGLKNSQEVDRMMVDAYSRLGFIE